MAGVILLQPDNGRLVAIKSSTGAKPGILTVSGLKDGTSEEVIITGFRMGAEVSAQNTPTIGGPEYICGFGDRLSDIQISMVVYPRSCDNSQQISGYAKAWKYYHENRIQPTKVNVIKLTFCGLTIHGLIRAFMTVAEVSAGTSIIQAELRLSGWVDPTSLNSSANATQASPDSTAGVVTTPSGVQVDAATGAIVSATNNWNYVVGATPYGPKTQAQAAKALGAVDSAKVARSQLSAAAAAAPTRTTTARQPLKTTVLPSAGGT